MRIASAVFACACAPALVAGFCPATTTFQSKILPSTAGSQLLAPRQQQQSRKSSLQALPSASLLLANDAEGAKSTLDSVWSSSLFQYFMQVVISNGIPALFAVAVIGFTASQLRSSRNDSERDGDSSSTAVAALYDDLYGDQDQSSSGGKGTLSSFLSSSSSSSKNKNKLPKNIGIPAQEFLKISHLNRQFEAYDFSMQAATQSKAAAARTFRQVSLSRALQAALADIDSSNDANNNDNIRQELIDTEQQFLSAAKPLAAELESLQAAWTRQAAGKAMKSMGLESADQLYVPGASEAGNNSTSSSKSSRSKKDQTTVSASQLTQVQTKLYELEAEFVERVVTACGTERAASIQTAISGSGATSLLTALENRPLESLLLGKNASDTASGKRVYVARFPGDTTASQVENLRQEVTAICRNARPGVDEALIVLQTGGGTVTGYGLAAAQLLRLKNEANLKLTIAVEQVAASGGYMMCCVADRIVASPFAVLGSIGVISDIPNVYDRLQREGIEFQTVTAGKYKRTLTPTKKPTKKDFEKTKADVEDILVLFKDFVHQNRPSLDIDNVATGETWFGQDALDRKLCDEIKTVDTVFREFVEEGYDVYEVEYKPPKEKPFAGLGLGASSSSGDSPLSGLAEDAAQWLVATTVKTLRNELASGDAPLKQRYLAKDDPVNRYKVQD